MPPTGWLPPPTGDVVPYPGSCLFLGAGRWLLQTGEVSTVQYGRSCSLTAQTLKYWQDAAVRGGNVLEDLIV